MALSALASGLITSAASAALNTAGSATSNAISTHKQWVYQKKMNDWNAAQATLAYQRQREFYQDMWNQETEYNTPANQIARLRAAGINPNLAYANGGIQNVGNTSATSVPQSSDTLSGNYSAPDLSSVGSNAVNDFYKGYMNAAQIKIMKQQADKIQKENEYQGLENMAKAATIYDEIKSKKAKYGADDKFLASLQEEALNHLKNQNQFDKDTMDDRESSVKSQSQIDSMNVAIRAIDHAFATERLPYAKRMAAMEWLQQVQTLVNLKAQGVLTKAQANKAYSDMTLNSKLCEMYKQNIKESKARVSNINQDTKTKELGNSREAIQQWFDFKNPLFGDGDYVNYRSIGNFIEGATGVAVDLYKAKKGRKSKGMSSQYYKFQTDIQNSSFSGTTTW